MVFRTILISLSLLVSQAPEQLTESKKIDVERLLQLTTAPLMTRVISEIALKDLTDSLKVAFPDLPETAQLAAIDEARAVLREFTNEFLKDLYPAYNVLFTQSEIRELLAFYDTPLGKKVLSAVPVLEAEGRVAAQKQVKALYPKITARVLDRLRKQGVRVR
jgi:hypothetical protein